MKGRKTALAVLTLIFVISLIFAFGCTQQKTYYTVTFMDGETEVGTAQVEKGKKIESYPAVHREDEYDFLDGWCMDEDLTREWDGTVERVTKDITLWANFLKITEAPGNGKMENEAFSNTLTWLQRGLPENPVFGVQLLESEKISRTEYDYGNAVYTKENCPVTVEKYKGESDIYKVSWTVDEKPLGGIYGASISFENGTYLAGNLLYKGAGTEENPYLIADSTDFTAINVANVEEDTYYKVNNSFNLRVSSSKIAGHTFGGNLDGNGKTVTIEASDAGLFNSLGETAVITDLTVDGSIPGVSENCTGVIANSNYGKITYCNVTATVISENGTIGTLDGGKDGIEGGAGGIVGINFGTVANCSFKGTVQANIGAGGIAAVNNGTVEACTFGGTLGAGNANETGTSTKKYSYMGGVVAINYGTVTKCSTAGSGKLLAQRSESGNSPNNNIGGIAALNAADGTITECWFEGIRVHGNNNVGGIAGENAGTINYCFAAATYQSGPKVRSYVGGYTNIGGIVGLTSGGSVSNCFVTCNIYAYGGTAYAVASSSTNCIYLGFSFDNREEVSASLTVPAGENNIKVAEAVAVLEKENSSFALPATYTYKVNPDDPESAEETIDYLATLNGGLSDGEQGKFSDANGVRLADENIETVTVHEISVTVHGESVVEVPVDNVSGNTVALSKNTAPAAPEGHYLVGWSLKENGEAVFGTKSVGYADLEELGLTSLQLYPVYAEGENPYDKILSVAVYKQYVDEEIIISLIEAFKTYCTENGKEVNEFNYTMIGNSSTNASAFCNTVKAGDFNIMFGQRANLTISVVGNTDTMLKVSGTARRIAKLSDEPEGTVAYEFYNFVLNADAAKKILDPTYITEAEADKIEVTLIKGETQYGEKLIVSNATDAANVALPTLPSEGENNFVGWKTSDGTQLSGAVGYEDLISYATDGKLTLTAEFKNVPTIVIAYYTTSDYCTEDEAKTIRDEFVAYYLQEHPEIEEVNVVLRAYSGNVKALVDAVLQAGDVDIVIGGGNNIDTTVGTSGEKLVPLSGKVAMPHKSSRNVIQLTEKGVTVEFMNYVAYINAQYGKGDKLWKRKTYKKPRLKKSLKTFSQKRAKYLKISL